MLTHADILNALTGPDDSITDPETGITFTLTSEPDPDTDISDFDCYGTVFPLGEGPEGCRTISYGNAGAWSWLPPADYTEAEADEAEYATAELCAYGFHGLIVTATETTEHPSAIFPTTTYADRHEVASAALFGIEPSSDPSYIQDITDDLIAQVLDQLPLYQ